MTPTEAIPGTVVAIIGVLHDAVTPMLIIITVTHHTKDHPHVGVLQLIQKIVADPDQLLHIKPNKKTPYKLSSHPSRTPARTQDRRQPQVTIDDLQTDFYSTDDNSSDSKEDEGHLN